MPVMFSVPKPCPMPTKKVRLEGTWEKASFEVGPWL